jgi:hypothetical protein
MVFFGRATLAPARLRAVNSMGGNITIAGGGSPPFADDPWPESSGVPETNWEEKQR